MLVLQRGVDEAIRIGPEAGPHIWVMVMSIDHGRVRLGIDAPKDVKILRGELLPSEEGEVQP